jgi:hypothetical protein
VVPELGPNEALVWESGNRSCAFYVFWPPKVWGPWFVLGWPLPPRLWRGPEGALTLQYRTRSVIPMGGRGVVGICQHVLRSFNPHPGVSRPGEFELRKDCPVPDATLHRTRAFFLQYMDDWDAGESSCSATSLIADPGLGSWRSGVRPSKKGMKSGQWSRTLTSPVLSWERNP